MLTEWFVCQNLKICVMTSAITKFQPDETLLSDLGCIRQLSPPPLKHQLACFAFFCGFATDFQPSICIHCITLAHIQKQSFSQE